MRIGSYDFELSRIIEEIKRNNYKRILLQLPDGIKMHALKIVDEIERKTNTKVIISTDPCYGACDVPLEVRVDMIVQLGHLPIPNLSFSMPVMFVNVSAHAYEKKAVRRAIEKLQGKKIGLLTTAQHIEKISEMVELLRESGFVPVIGRGNKRIAREGQILGCNVSAAKSIENEVDSFLFIGSGRFHALAIALSTKKPVIAVDPFTLEVLKEERDILIRRRYGYIVIAQKAKVFGIIVCTKPGQTRERLAEEIERKLRRKGKRVYRLVANTIEPSIANRFPDIECFISTACPRVAIDEAFPIPILTPVEVEILLGERGIEEYVLDTI